VIQAKLAEPLTTSQVRKAGLPPLCVWLLLTAHDLRSFDQQRLGNRLEVFQFARGHFHPRGEYSLDPLRQKLRRHHGRGADEFYNVSTAAPMFAYYLRIRF